jgi:hypothetical protein
MPAFGPEWEFTIRQERGGRATVRYVSAVMNIRRALDEVVRAGGRGAGAEAPAVAIEERVGVFSASIAASWRDRLLEQMRFATQILPARERDRDAGRPVRVVLDGDVWQCWYLQESAVIQMRISESEVVAETGGVALADWAASIRDGLRGAQ